MMLIKDGISLANIGLATTFDALGSGTIGAITGTSRTLSANIAEQIRQVALKKENITIESANKKFLVRKFFVHLEPKKMQRNLKN